MNPTSTSRNYLIPLDVLGLAFEYYATEETIKYPLETLLLVCKTWKRAALDNRTVWGTFKIHIAHRPSTRIWSTRLPLRLARSGDFVPLDIEIRNLMDRSTHPFMEDIDYQDVDMTPTYICPPEIDGESGMNRPCTCQAAAYRCVCDLVTLLAGLDGRHCARWRSLVLDLNSETSSRRGDPRVAVALSYPMPLLVSLTLHHTCIDNSKTSLPFLPYTPSLTLLALDDSFHPPIQHTANLRFAGLSWLTGWHASVDPNFECIQNSTELEVLKVSLPRHISPPLPSELPALWKLELNGAHLPSAMTMTVMPNLTHLSIRVCGMRLISRLADCEGMPFHRVKALQLLYENVEKASLSSLVKLIHSLFVDLRSLETIVGDLRMLSIVLKLIWETSPVVVRSCTMGSSSRYSAPLFGGREVSFKVICEDSWQTLLFPPARNEVIEAARQLGAIHPEEKWDYVFWRLSRPWRGPW